MISASHSISVLRALVLAGIAAVYGIPTLATEPLPPGHPPIPDPPTYWPGNSLGPNPASPRDFYLTTLHSQVEQNCVGCHRTGGTAEQSGARLVLSDLPDDSHEAFAAFLTLGGVDSDWVLGKVTGQYSHGGGRVTTEGSALYQNLDQYLALLTGNRSTISNEDFWRDTRAEPPEITLRRASLLFGGKVASDEAIAAAKQSEAGLRERILATMEGEGFRDFIINGANDRLLIEGLLNGIDFGIATRDRYPSFSEFVNTLPEERPEQYEDYHDFPFLTDSSADWDLRWAIIREPLELIAHIVMTDTPYQQVLTADYTMVNAFSDIAYRSQSGFSQDLADAKGFYDRRSLGSFKPGRNVGHIPHDEVFEFDGSEIKSFSGFQEWPHSGVLTTQAWLTRYPSTDTNRNRARARWTYFHFLGVDIEKSAPRTTDPVALADTNNPTMNNPACTVCHERMDPVAGAYQSFGDLGHYLDQWGGMDSLSDSYKCPECYGGEQGSTGYQQGDTWYRDMRAPGFNGEVAEGQRDSLQWLGYRIANDPRFAAATVRFWWPAVFGAEPLTAPEDPDGPNYDQRLNAFNEQERLVNELASKFEASGFRARALFADMTMSKWYRHSEVDSAEAVAVRSLELATVGSGRLLTPEELDRKTKAVFGRAWRQWLDGNQDPHNVSQRTALSGERADFRGFYGGIDGAAVTARNRELTPLMSNVTESMAMELACQVVIEDFSRAPADRFAFAHVEKNTVPGGLASVSRGLAGKVSQWDEVRRHSVTVSAHFVGGGPVLLRVSDLTQNAYQSTDENHTEADLTIKWISFVRDGAEVERISGRYLSSQPGFVGDQYEDQNGQLRFRGDVQDDGWRMHEGAWIEFLVDLPPASYEVQFGLGTTLLSNNINDEMTVGLSLTATANTHLTESGQLFIDQVKALVMNTTHRAISDGEASQLMELIAQRGREESALNSNFWGRDGRCDTWMLWQGKEDQSWYADEKGMMRGWIMFVHGLMTSFGYLHD